MLEDEAISVRAFEIPALSDERRQQIADDLKQYFAEVDASRKPASADEADDVVTEAIRSSRPGYRPLYAPLHFSFSIACFGFA